MVRFNEKWRELEKKVAALKWALSHIGYPMTQPLVSVFPEVEKMIIDSESAFAGAPDLAPEISDQVAKRLEEIDKAIQFQTQLIHWLPGGDGDIEGWRKDAESLRGIVSVLYDLAHSGRL